MYVHTDWICVYCSSLCALLPQPSILSSSSSRYDFGDEDAGVVAHVRVVCSPCYAKAQAWVTLQFNANKTVIYIHVKEKVFLWLHAVLWKNKKHSSIEVLQQHFNKADVYTLTGTLKYLLFLFSSHSVVDLLRCLGSMFCFIIRLGFSSRLTLDYFGKQWSLCSTQWPWGAWVPWL